MLIKKEETYSNVNTNRYEIVLPICFYGGEINFSVVSTGEKTVSIAGYNDSKNSKNYVFMGSKVSTSNDVNFSFSECSCRYIKVRVSADNTITSFSYKIEYDVDNIKNEENTNVNDFNIDSYSYYNKTQIVSKSLTIRTEIENKYKIQSVLQSGSIYINNVEHKLLSSQGLSLGTNKYIFNCNLLRLENE